MWLPENLNFYLWFAWHFCWTVVDLSRRLWHRVTRACCDIPCVQRYSAPQLSLEAPCPYLDSTEIMPLFDLSEGRAYPFSFFKHALIPELGRVINCTRLASFYWLFTDLRTCAEKGTEKIVGSGEGWLGGELGGVKKEKGRNLQSALVLFLYSSWEEGKWEPILFCFII